MVESYGIDSYLLTGEDAVRIDVEQSYVFGRSREVEFTINDLACSRKHCRLRWDPTATWMIDDLGSKNGTLVDGQRTVGSRPIGDRSNFQVGGQRFELRLLPPGADPDALLQDVGRSDSFDTMEMESGNFLSPAAGFGGAIPAGGLQESLRFFAMTNKTGRFEIEGEDERCIWFVDGVPRHAVAGPIDGEDALQKLLNATGTFMFHEHEVCPGEWSITGRPQDILAKFAAAEGKADRRLASDVERAARLQRHLLERVPEVRGYDIGVFFQGESGVSGDFFDVSWLPRGRVLLTLGDVSGHGVQAAMAAVSALKTMRLLAPQEDDLCELMVRVNNELLADLPPAQFITIFAAILEPISGRVDMVLAGHHQTLGWCGTRDKRRWEHWGSNGLLLGMVEEDAFRAAISQVSVQLDHHGGFLAFSDGLLEAADAEGRQFDWAGVEHAAHDELPWARDMAEFTAKIAARVNDYAASIEDDVTILAIRRQAADAEACLDQSTACDGAATAFANQSTAPRLEAKLGEETHSFSSVDPLIGQRLGRVMIHERLGHGSMGRVYRGQHEALRVDVAVKVLDIAGAIDEAQRERFADEMRRAMQVHHPSLVQVMDAGWTDEGAAYLIMEYVAGDNLAERLFREGQLAIDDVLHLAEGMIGGLAAIHEADALHRDFKPSNVLIDRRGRPKIADLGLARVINDPATEQVTGQRAVQGSPLYLAPEAIDARRGSRGPAADIYSFGATCYHLLAGRPPYPGTANLEVLRAHLKGGHEPLQKLVPDLERGLAKLFESCLHADPRKRPTALQILGYLHEVQGGGKLSTHVYTRHATGSIANTGAEDGARRRSELPWIIALVVLGGGLLAALLLLLSSEG